MKRASKYLHEAIKLPSLPSAMVATKVFVVPYFSGINTGSHSLFAIAFLGESSLTFLSMFSGCEFYPFPFSGWWEVGYHWHYGVFIQRFIANSGEEFWLRLSVNRAEAISGRQLLVP